MVFMSMSNNYKIILWINSKSFFLWPKTSQKNTKLFSHVAHIFLELQQVLVLYRPDYGWNVFYCVYWTCSLDTVRTSDSRVDN
jgi:hypothetical protein